ncbi:unnamed protein product [Heligmosomoides polygyrus]|uniref:Guanylate cyclase domain-containing protein n=1 Tax=Heligmosomoides polygyrus TaxID=6339 RepID=A0A183FVK4_HELPZ|nr:unnamed protein product [Heligmosomoides polygyrus]
MWIDMSGQGVEEDVRAVMKVAPMQLKMREQRLRWYEHSFRRPENHRIKAGKIHLSSDANQLIEVVGGYRTEKRGEVIIKGKGVMETYWLIGTTDGSAGPEQCHDAGNQKGGGQGSADGTRGIYEEYKQSTPA